MNAREQLIAAMAGVLSRTVGSTPRRDPLLAGRLLDALFSARLPVSCTTCSGTGMGRIPEGDGVHYDACRACSGSGTTPGSLAIVVALVEAGVLVPCGSLQGTGARMVDQLWRFDPPVYRVLVDTETKP